MLEGRFEAALHLDRFDGAVPIDIDALQRLFEEGGHRSRMLSRQVEVRSIVGLEDIERLRVGLEDPSGVSCGHPELDGRIPCPSEVDTGLPLGFGYAIVHLHPTDDIVERCDDVLAMRMNGLRSGAVLQVVLDEEADVPPTPNDPELRWICDLGRSGFITGSERRVKVGGGDLPASFPSVDLFGSARARVGKTRRQAPPTPEGGIRVHLRWR